MFRRLSFLVLVLLAWSFFGCDNLGVSNGNIVGKATLPLLPIDLPIYPTDVTLDGLVGSVKDNLGLAGSLLSNNYIQGFLDEVEAKLKKASIEILQPGTLSGAVGDQVAETFQTYVQVTRVGVNIANDTNEWVSVPVEFKLYLGDGDLVDAWSEDAVIPFADPQVNDGQFIVKPGESIDLSIDNVQQLVDTLNNSKKFGIGYKALYRMADFENGADVVAFLEKFGVCLVEGLIADDTSQCPSVEQMIGWHLTVKKFELVIEAQSDLHIPEIPGCTQFAQEYKLDLLKQACPTGGN
jgi:hypothetical protein